MSESLQHRHDISDKNMGRTIATFTRTARAMGRNRKRQQEVHQWRILDTSDRSTVA